ncbi:MAG: hypothetical protein ACYTFH_05875 [Planctomycetota bacterium]
MMALHDEHPDDGPPRDVRAPIDFGRLLREGDAQRLGALPTDRDLEILAEIRNDFGLDPEEDRTPQAFRSQTERTVPWSRRLRLALQPMAAIAGVALLFLLVRDHLLPAQPAATPPAGGLSDRLAMGPRPPAASPMRRPADTAAPTAPNTEAPAAPAETRLAMTDVTDVTDLTETFAPATVPALLPTADRLSLAAAARRTGQAESLAVLLTSLVVAGDELPGVASPDLPAAIAAIAAGFENAGVERPEAVPATVSLKAPADPAAAFGVWEIELALETNMRNAIEDPAAGPVELVGWRVAIDLGDLDVVAVGDGRLAGFTSPPTYDPAALTRGTLVLAGVADRGVAIDGPVVVARLQARGLAADAVSPMPLAAGSFAAIERGSTP